MVVPHNRFAPVYFGPVQSKALGPAALMNTAARRLHFVDALKAIASQFIVLHHLAFYGPLSLAAYALAPGEITWFARYARIAVQVFLVIGGFLAARNLAPHGRLTAPHPAALLGKRYLRLALPYVAMLLISIVCAALARQWMDDDSIPAAPTLWQFTAHMLLLQGILEVDSLSAGVWYVAIDFQLFALMLGILWLAHGARRPWLQRVGPLTIGMVGVTSLFFFNRDAAWDDWAVYFFGAYAMGAMAYWGSREGGKRWLVAMGVAVLASLYFDYQPCCSPCPAVLAGWTAGHVARCSPFSAAFRTRCSWCTFPSA
jgi:peptidoglycan/LPS O-acetylase OafA/YrhL